MKVLDQGNKKLKMVASQIDIPWDEIDSLTKPKSLSITMPMHQNKPIHTTVGNKKEHHFLSPHPHNPNSASGQLSSPKLGQPPSE